VIKTKAASCAARLFQWQSFGVSVFNFDVHGQFENLPLDLALWITSSVMVSPWLITRAPSSENTSLLTFLPSMYLICLRSKISLRSVCLLLRQQCLRIRRFFNHAGGFAAESRSRSSSMSTSERRRYRRFLVAWCGFRCGSRFGAGAGAGFGAGAAGRAACGAVSVSSRALLPRSPPRALPRVMNKATTARLPSL